MSPPHSTAWISNLVCDRLGKSEVFTEAVFLIVQWPPR
jgi:hypothetical protein